MPSSRKLIQSTTLSNTSASVTFSSIPQDYTDLSLIVTGRTNDNEGNFNKLMLFINGGGGMIYSTTFIRGTSSMVSGRTSNTDEMGVQFALDDAGDTANTFGSIEIYIPSYKASQNKPMGTFAAAEENDFYAAIESNAGLFRSTSPITSIQVSNQSAYYVAGSSFYLYGIKSDGAV